MTEFEKMRNGEFYDYYSQDCLDSYIKAKRLCAKLQTMTIFDADYRAVIEELIPGIPESATVSPPFICDHGNGIKLSENVFINYGATMIDGGLITIGANTQIGPNATFATPNHPIDYLERRKTIERCLPITIGEDCWFGAGVTVCTGVTIGDRCIIGAGSVVVKDIPSDSMAVGNPAKVIKNLNIGYKEEAIECVKDCVLPLHKEIYAKYNGDFDRIYSEGYNSRSYQGRVIKPGQEYELSYLECSCPKVKCGLRTNPEQCECSRQSILYILSQLEPTSRFDVRIVNTILRGADRCTFRITMHTGVNK